MAKDGNSSSRSTKAAGSRDVLAVAETQVIPAVSPWISNSTLQKSDRLRFEAVVHEHVSSPKVALPKGPAEGVWFENRGPRSMERSLEGRSLEGRSLEGRSLEGRGAEGTDLSSEYIDTVEPLAVDPADPTRTLIAPLLLEQVTPRIAINTRAARLISSEQLESVVPSQD